MDRFEYSEARMIPGEAYILREKGVKLYDGDSRTSFESGELVLTTHRLLWGRPGDIPKGLTCLSLPLRYIIFAEEEASGFGFNRSRKMMLHLSESSTGKLPGPVGKSKHDYIKLGFSEGIDNDFLVVLTSTVAGKMWESLAALGQPSTSEPPAIKPRTGIGGIERDIQARHKATDDSISVAFQDLSKLMNMAKEMVSLSQNISRKIREKQGDITEDETVRFKSYLLSLGIEDPVTRDDFRSDSQYYKGLARQLAEILLEPIQEAGGMMALTDAYCRVNRARGLEMLSPEDLLQACRTLDKLGLPIRLREFDSGVMVLQLQTHSDEYIVALTKDALEEKGSLTGAELAQSLGIALLLANERLLTTEKYGMACRDDSIHGLCFYPNLFLQQD